MKYEKNSGQQFSQKMAEWGRQGGEKNAQKFIARRLHIQADYLINPTLTAPQLAQKHKIPVSTAYAYIKVLRPQRGIGITAEIAQDLLNKMEAENKRLFLTLTTEQKLEMLYEFSKL